MPCILFKNCYLGTPTLTNKHFCSSNNKKRKGNFIFIWIHLPRVRDLAMKIWNSWPKTCEQYTSDFQISNPFTTIGRPVQEFPLSNLSSLWQPLKFFSRLFHRMVNQNFSLLFFFAKVSYWKFGVEIFKDIVSISSYPSSGEIWRWHWLDEMQNIQWFSVWYYSEIRNNWNWNTYDLLP